MARKRKYQIGRPTDFRKAFSEQAWEQCLAGATDADLAQFFGVASSTLSLWKRKHPEFSEALRRGKEVAQGEVAMALYRAATGYERLTCKVVNGQVFELKEWVPGDVAAMKYFLNNRARKHWRNDPDVSVEVNNCTLHLPQDIIDAANAARIARMEQARSELGSTVKIPPPRRKR